MKKLLVIITLILAASISGGCAVIPAIVTTGASMAVPQTASLAITAVGTAHKTVLVAADERHMDDMLSDKITTITAQAVIMAETGTDMEATCLNGDLYVVGEYATPADRDSVIDELQRIKGVNSVKGVLKQMPTSLVALVEPTINDRHAETVIESGLIAKLHIKSANVDVEVVQGEAVIVGVVENAEEAQAVTRLVEELRPQTAHPVKVTSLLAVQDAFDTGAPQPNEMFALMTSSQMLAANTLEADKPAVMSVASNERTPATEPVINEKPSMESLLAVYEPNSRSPWQKARLNMKHRILNIAKAESDPAAKKELITLSTRVLKDKQISIENRLVRTLNRTSNLAVKVHVDSILQDVAPKRTHRIRTLAMN